MSKKESLSPLTFEACFRIPNFLYRAMGFHFERKLKYTKLDYFTFLFLAMELCAHGFTRYILFTELIKYFKLGEILNMLHVASYIGFASDTNVKGLTFVLHLKTLRNVYEILRKEFPTLDSKSQRDYSVHQYDLPKRVRLCIGFYFGSVWLFYYVAPLLRSICGMFFGEDAGSFTYLKPMPIEYDFNYRQPLIYICVYLVESLNLHLTTVMSMGTDTWLWCFVSQICMHLDYVSRMLENYQPHESHSKQDCEFLHNLVRKHQLMHELHAKIISVFGISLVINALTSMGVVCLVGVDVTLYGFGIDFLKFISFFLAYVIQFFFVCNYGQKLKATSEDIVMGAYKQCWYNGSQSYKRELLMIIRRSQEPMELSAYGFHPINLDTFKFVMSMSYRVFALLQTMLTD